jgi:hypothetical protein
VSAHANVAHAHWHHLHGILGRPSPSRRPGERWQCRPEACLASGIVLLTGDGLGTNEIMRRTGKSKTCVWRWQERFMEEGVEVLLHDKTRPSRICPAR